MTLIQNDGSEIITTVSAAPIHDARGRFQASVAVFTDITRRRQVELEREDANAVLEQITNTSGGGMRIIDRDFNMIRFNPVFLDMAGLSFQQASTLKCYDAFSSPNCHTPSCPLVRILAGEDRVESEEVKQSPGGDRIPCHLIATPYREPDGRVTGIVRDFREMF